MRQGKQAGGRAINPPYGLGDPAQAETVKRIYAEFIDMYRHATLSEIAHGLNLDEIPSRRGGMWHVSTVQYILANPIYATAHIVDADTWATAQRRLRQLRRGPAR